MAVSMAGLVAVSGCTPQQIADAVAKASTEQATPAPAPEQVIASVDCQTFNIEISGYPDGTDVLVGEGDQPPYGFTVGSAQMWQFTPIAGGGKAALPIGLYQSTHAFNAVIEVGGVRVFDEYVDCTPIS